MKGIAIDIFRGDFDCTNNGVSNRENAKGKVFVVFDEAIAHGNYYWDECKNDPRIVPLRIVRRNIGSRGEYMHLESHSSNTRRPMMGGNFGYSTDSRFREVSAYPLPIHDRFE